jgi:hypothetical protein
MISFRFPGRCCVVDEDVSTGTETFYSMAVGVYVVLVDKRGQVVYARHSVGGRLGAAPSIAITAKVAEAARS